MPDGIDDISTDAIFNRRVWIRQRRKGYRFSVDAVLLAWYASMLPANRVLDLGTGSGVVALAMAYQNPGIHIDAVEIQESLASLATENVLANDRTRGRITVHRADLRELSGPDWENRYDLVVSNPPFRAVGNGRLNPEAEKATARHELQAKLVDVMRSAGRCLRRDGYLAMIILAEREDDLHRDAEAAGLEIVQKTGVLPFPGKPANLLMVTLAGHAGAHCSESSIPIWQENNIYTPGVEKILAGEWDNVEHPLLPLTK